jgi:carbonyl reductase 1
METFAAHLKQEHGDGIDLVINNAAIALNGFGIASLLLIP